MRRIPTRRKTAPRYPTLHEGKKLLLAGVLGVGLSGCGASDLYTAYPPVTESRDASVPRPPPRTPDAGDLTMGVAPMPEPDAAAPGPDAEILMMGEAPEPGLDAATPGPDAGDFFMGDIAAPELDGGTR